jgi:CMP-N-acetylneuraminic acid synthetase
VNVAIIPARGGSRRIPKKNIRPFHGRPIIAYSIEAAWNSGLFRNIIVSTDDDEIEREAFNRGASVFRRVLDDGERGTQEVAAEVLESWRGFDYACCIYATAPMLTAQDLRNGFELLGERPYLYIPGIYYWGRAEAFARMAPLTDGIEVAPLEERFIDINTPEEWEMAERMYAELHNGDRK